MASHLYDQLHGPMSPCIRLAHQDVSQICILPSVTHRPAIEQNTFHTPTSANPTRIPPPAKPMQAVISHLVPQATIQHVQAMSSVHCQRAYGVQISDGTSLVLVAPPPPMVKLLRSERASVVSEAAILRWLAKITIDQPLLQDWARKPEVALGVDAALGSEGADLDKSIGGAAEDLQPFLPKLIAHTVASNEAGREFNLMRPTLGVPIPELNPPLSLSERKTIDFQTGQLYRKLCKLVSPTGRFGPAYAVLPLATCPTPDATRPARRDVNTSLVESRGVQSWSMAFHSMLEAVLRDGEDMQVMLGYSSIRRHFKRFRYTLDDVTTPRLVAVDAGKDLNTLVVRKVRRKSTGSPVSSRRQTAEEDQCRTHVKRDSDDSESELHDSESELHQDEHIAPYNQSNTIMSGMKDWSNFVFGDPLFAVNFCSGPSSEFLLGFNGTSPNQESSAIFSSDIIEDKENAHVRLLLYECYHTVTYIAREFFRPRKDGTGRELEARKTLNKILAQLDAMDSVDDQRGRRPSGETSPAKRSRSGDKDK
ncbi:uncharacterized protein CTRU02_206052 [Colletotrichum truncatum]|uniref:Uncharacterized protein n=1 Tax=Colletotrichum truncatum TaxID=5467 RepID=A0ACC3Z5R4_COLTU|nr:uncharacterized protein CTRU02_10537 [Colletotrichum truncatum]KAF6787273.1 hypothetical protein CTRU02_10537 [Colletotrichum truncatum]